MFDGILASHGCNASGRGIMHDLEWQGFGIELSADWRWVLAVNGVEHEVVKPPTTEVVGFWKEKPSNIRITPC